MKDILMTQTLATLATNYLVNGKAIPPRLTIEERKTFALGAGLSQYQATLMAVQDRASSLANILGALIASSGNSELIATAERAVARWNEECTEFFKV